MKILLVKMLFLIIFLPIVIHAMEQEKDECSFVDLFKETGIHFIAQLVSVIETPEEACATTVALSKVNSEFRAVINDTQNNDQLIKLLHKRFKIKKIVALEMLYTQEARYQLVKNVTQYAFLNHNDLFRKYKNARVGGMNLAMLALKNAYRSLSTMKKSDLYHWKNADAREELYKNVTARKVIKVNVDAYQGLTQGKEVSAMLLCLAENYHNFLDKDYLNELEFNSLSNLLFSKTYRFCFPHDGSLCIFYEEAKDRIVPVD